MVQFPVPESMLAWPLYGAGLENLGRGGRPVRWPVPRPGRDQVLARIDAVGLCYSDVKIIRLGGEHPRLYGRDLATEPIIQGHEVSLTIVAVGEHWQTRFTPGERFAVQADIYHHGRNLAFGYIFPGGLEEYTLLGPEILAGDEGCYLVPAGSELGYAEVALTEPWACVEAAYMARRRTQVKPGGVLWLVGGGDTATAYELGETFRYGRPARVLCTDVPEGLRRQLAAEAPAPERLDGLAPADYAARLARIAPGGVDDIILLAQGQAPVRAAQVEALSALTAAGATMSIVAGQPLDRPAALDVGRIHYDGIAYLGTPGLDLATAYGPLRNRCEVRPDGVAWIVGGGGPMGRMHLQRLLEMQGGPRRVVVTESNPLRGDELVAAFGPMARERGTNLRVFSPRMLAPAKLHAALAEAHEGSGFDDIVVVVAKPEAIEESLPYLGPSGLLAVFGGLPRGTMATLDISSVYLHGAQITGTSGSRISDQAAVMHKLAAGHLSTAQAVAAIGGLAAARDGLQALIDRRYAGKVVIYPRVRDFPLTALPDLAQIAPQVHALLDAAGHWTRSAEAALMREFEGEGST